MKMKRYIASDMRAALRQIREEQGPDAVLLSTRQTHEGVEICAAVDMELAGGQGTLAETAALKQLEQAALLALEHADHTSVEALADANAAGTGEFAGLDAYANSFVDQRAARPAAASVGEELRSLRGLLEQQLAALAWNDFTRREPLQARALTDLTHLGLARDIALGVMRELPSDMTAEQGLRLPYALLARRVAVGASPCEQGGALALVGPAGSGKTTTLAKLAARWVLEHDADSLGIVSADYERLGSHEQLRTLGRLLGVQVCCVNGAGQLAASLDAVSSRKLILIDTPGRAPRDPAAAQEIANLRALRTDLITMMIVPASAQAGIIEATVAQAAAVGAGCCTLTHLDEAVSLGGALSALTRAQLPVVWVSEGARIPEDLRPARAHQLVVRAVELARASAASIDEDLLVRRYGESVNAAA